MCSVLKAEMKPVPLRPLLSRHDGAFLDKSVRLAINNEIVVDPHPVSRSDEIAFMPPVGGG